MRDTRFRRLVLNAGGTPMQYGWSNDYDHWRRVRHTLQGRRWFVTSYAAGYENTVPSGSGIYMISLLASEAVEATTPWTLMQAPIYIGKSKNLHRRFKEHVYNRSHIGPYVNHLPRLKYHYCLIDKDQLTQVESQLVLAFGPKVNSQQPTVFNAIIGTPIEI